MSRIKILADMNISPITVRTLNVAGWETVRVPDDLQEGAVVTVQDRIVRVRFLPIR